MLLLGKLQFKYLHVIEILLFALKIKGFTPTHPPTPFANFISEVSHIPVI